MRLLDLTFDAAEENLACDEALLDLCEDGGSDELLRFWEPESYFVVLGYSNPVKREVREEFCRKNKIPVLRRVSGGGTVLQGPGCLNYSLVLRIGNNPNLKSITSTNRFVMQKNAEALEKCLQKNIEVRGITDLAGADRKFSGNSQRRKRNFALFHGTFLFDFDLSMIAKTLLPPQKEPAYREGRTHENFLMNLDVSQDVLKECLVDAWRANEEFKKVPLAHIAELIRTRYSLPEWNKKF